MADSRISANLPAGGSPSRDGIKSLERLQRVCITPYVLTQSINTGAPEKENAHSRTYPPDGG